MKYPDWKIPNKSASAPQALLEAGYTPLLAALLEARGISDTDEVHGFLFGGEELLADPMLMADMPKAVNRIKTAIEKREKIAVYGDYDVDGITAACLVTDYIRGMGMDCLLYIPDRIEEGYGLNAAAIKTLRDQGVDLIITVDCGVTAIVEAEYASQIGVDMIITDHHECRDELPSAIAVINPKRPDCTYPNQSMAGVGVAFKLLCALEGDATRLLDQYADIVTVGTIADVMPLSGENRYITKRGIEKLNKNPRPGFAALLIESGMSDKSLTAMNVSFSLAPKLNAAGRLGKVEIATRLLLTVDEKEARTLAEELFQLNRSRQALEMEIWKQAEAMLEGTVPKGPIVLASEEWHQGVVGIAASRLAECYSVPAVMICIDGESGKGSCRSYGFFNLFEALNACSEHLQGFGGHALAAGLNIRRENVDNFRKAFEEYYHEHPPEYVPKLELDLLIDEPAFLSMDCVESLDLMEPCGNSNPKPQMCLLDAVLESIIPIGGGRHLRLQISKFGRTYDCVLFSCTQEELGHEVGDRIDVAFSLKINEFRGRRSVQLHIIDVKSHNTLPMCFRVLEELDTLTPLESATLLPDRKELALIWRKLENIGGNIEGNFLETLSNIGTDQIKPEKVCACLGIFKEINLLKMNIDGENVKIEQILGSGKKELSKSKILRKLSGI